MRNKFINCLISRAKKDESIILITGDLGYNLVEPFQNKFPERFINAGICEQNMASMAAGMASEGFKVFIYSIANFPTFRCSEQIRNDICYHNLDVTIVSVGGGVAYGNLGYSHHAIQDYGLMRLFPEMTILSPGDPLEVDLCMNYIFKDKYPKYLRLHKAGEKTVTINKEPLYGGIWRKLTNENSNNIFLSTGNGLDIAFKMKNFDKYNNYDIYTCPIWGSKFIESQLLQSKKFNKIITVEDHLFSCGFGSWIQESLYKNKLLELDFISLDENIIGKVGCEDYLLNFLKKPDI